MPAVEGGDDAETVRAAGSGGCAGATVSGIYAIGAGNRGLVRARRTITPKPVTIVHELTPTSRSGLREGLFDLVLDQGIALPPLSAAIKIYARSDRRPRLAARCRENPIECLLPREHLMT